MKVLVVGSGGREHALVRCLQRSPQAPEVLCAPGNAGIRRDARPLEVAAGEPAEIAAAARDAGVDGTVVIGALVCVDGRVYDVRRVVSMPMPDAAAEDAVRNSSFRPALKGGQPVAAWLDVPVEFRLP